MKKCPICNRIYQDNDRYCLNDNYPLVPYDADLERKKNEEKKQANVVKCPYCSSTNVSKISTLGRVASVGLFGLASGKVGKQWHCNQCKSDF